MDLSILSKKVGPLPVGGWLAVGGAGLYFGRWWAAKAGAPAAAPTYPGFAVDGSAASGAAPPAMGEPDTNDAWARRVITALIAEGVEPTAAQRAIVNFLNGYPLTRTESLIVDRALILGGVPPEGVPPVTIEGSGPTTQPVESPWGPTYQPPSQPPPPTSYPTTPSLTDIYGSGTAPSLVTQMPTTDLGSSIIAPSGGTFMYGKWVGDSLVAGVYSMPDGSTVNVGTW